MLQSITCSECEEPQKNGESVSWLANVPCKGQSIHMPVELPENGNKAEASGKVYAHIALAKLGAVFQCWKKLCLYCNSTGFLAWIWIVNSPQCSNLLQRSQLLNRLQWKRNHCTALLWERIGSKGANGFSHSIHKIMEVWWTLHMTRDWKILGNLLTWPMAHVFAPIPCGQQCTNPWRKQSMVTIKSKVSPRRETPSQPRLNNSFGHTLFRGPEWNPTACNFRSNATWSHAGRQEVRLESVLSISISADGQILVCLHTIQGKHHQGSSYRITPDTYHASIMQACFTQQNVVNFPFSSCSWTRPSCIV